MTRIGWAALMKLGMVELKLRPDEFWQLTPAELALMAGVSHDSNALSRKGLADLLARFPDGPHLREDGIKSEVE